MDGSWFPEPPLDEQRLIAAFLDRETARIDALVAKKQRLIELLEEKRTALISHAVTKGLDPNAPMKDSGVEWLGEVPRHWELACLKRRARKIQAGSTPPTVELRYYEDGSVPWHGPSSFSEDIRITEPVKMIAERAVADGVARLFAAGSILIGTIGSVGKVGLIEEASSCNQQITVVTLDSTRVLPLFAAYQMKRLEPVLLGIAPSTTLPILDQQEIGGLPLALPPLDEQVSITAHIETAIRRINTVIQQTREQISLLQERRTALISAAVRGKIDVREVAA